MADKTSDPIAMWHGMLGEMEKGLNSLANQTMALPEFSRAMNQFGGVSAGAQRQFGDLMEKYLSSMNLPSRVQLANMAERLQAIEGQLNEMTSLLRELHRNSSAEVASQPALPRPTRGKRPPDEDKRK